MASSTHDENDYMTELDEGMKFYETLMKLFYTLSVSVKDSDNRNHFSAVHKKVTNAYRDLCSIISWIELEQEEEEESPVDMSFIINGCISSIERDALEISTVYNYLTIKEDHDHRYLVKDKIYQEQHKNKYGEDDGLNSLSVNVDESSIHTLRHQDPIHIREMKKHQRAEKKRPKTKLERLRVEQDRLKASREAQIRKRDQESKFLTKYYVKAVQIASQDLLDLFHHRPHTA